jgi:hypothetical protein
MFEINNYNPSMVTVTVDNSFSYMVEEFKLFKNPFKLYSEWWHKFNLEDIDDIIEDTKNAMLN